jgi:hypothetical protein
MATAKKLGLSPERTELPVSGGETEFFADGEGEKPGLLFGGFKNSVSPREGGYAD